MRVSVITPCYNGGAFLPRCCASVADQGEALAEHIVVDGGSTDGTVEWLKRQQSLRWVSEKDRGMYDAINKGFRMAGGDIVAHLNCDEQYLPGTLAAVADVFARHPGVDIVFGDLVLVRPDGSPLAFRKAYPLRWPYVAASFLYVSTCTLFYRRRLIEEGFRLDPEYKTAGDADFVVRLLRAGYRTFHVKRFLSAFTMTGSNMGSSDAAAGEGSILYARAPGWVRRAAWLLRALRLLEKGLSGAYGHRGPVSYSIYTNDSPACRKPFKAEFLSCRWKTS